MNTVSRVQTIHRSEALSTSRHEPRAIRIVVEEWTGADSPQITLAPGDHLLIENRTSGRLNVAPCDFFGTAFSRSELAPGETTQMVVTGLWFQVELRTEDTVFFPLDVYLAPNAAE